VIAASLPPSRAREAFERAERAHHRGKIVLQVAGPPA
jgi:hypothetical protein